MSDGPTLYRRHVLALASGVLTATSGCLGFLGFGSSDDSDSNSDSSSEDTSTDSSQGNQNDETQNTTSEEAESDTEPQSENSTTENESTDQEEDEDEEEERQPTPDENDTEIDRDQYNQTEQKEVADRPQSDVSVTVDVSRATDNTITVSGTVTNTSDDPIDFVDVEVIYRDDTGSTVGTSLDTVRDLSPGASKNYKVRTSPVELRSEAAEVEVNPYPQDYTS